MSQRYFKMAQMRELLLGLEDEVGLGALTQNEKTCSTRLTQKFIWRVALQNLLMLKGTLCCWAWRSRPSTGV